MSAPVRLRKDLRFVEALSVVVGSLIGSGILRLPGNMAAILPSPGLVVVAWAASALIVLTGVLTVAELAAMYPRSGGQYHFIREGLGPMPAYLFGWTMFWVIMSGIVAGVSLAFADFLADLVPGGLPGAPTSLVIAAWRTGITLPAWGNAFVAIALILVLAFLNYLSSRYGGLVATVTAVGKYAGLLGLIAMIFVLGHGDASGFSPLLPADESAGGLALAFVAAVGLTFFAFGGWSHVVNIAAEVRGAERNLPRALLIGLGATAAIYIALTAAYFWVVPIGEAVAIGNDPEGRIAVAAARAAVGDWGGTAIGVLALVSLFGTVNASLLTGPRVFQAMARDGVLLKAMASLSEKRATPGAALFLFAMWSSLLVMSGIFVQIVQMVVFATWLFYSLTALAHLRLRSRRPALLRPFVTPFHPLMPLVFLLSGVAVVVVSLVRSSSRMPALLALGIIALSVPFYLLQQRRPRAPAAPPRHPT